MFAACGAPEELPSRAVDSPARPPRVVSLSPLATRFLLLLEADDRLVGVDRESARLPGLEGLPAIDHENVHSLAPDLVLVSPALRAGPALAASGLDVVAFAPANLEEVYAMFRDVGSRLVGPANALRREVALSRPLAMIGGESFGQRRLRTLAVTGFGPLEFAGAHSFETDLIEIAGAESVTHAHGVEAERIAVSPDRLAAYAPELILVITPTPPTLAERDAVFREVGPKVVVDFLTLDTRTFWLDAPTATARRFRDLILERTREFEARAPAPDERAAR